MSVWWKFDVEISRVGHAKVQVTVKLMWVQDVDLLPLSTYEGF